MAIGERHRLPLNRLIQIANVSGELVHDWFKIGVKMPTLIAWYRPHRPRRSFFLFPSHDLGRALYHYYVPVLV